MVSIGHFVVYNNQILSYNFESNKWWSYIAISNISIFLSDVLYSIAAMNFAIYCP